MYSSVVMDHFERPRNAGKPPRYNRVGISGDPNAGPFVILYLDIQDGRIQGVGFETYVCGPAIAAASILTEMIKDKSPEEAGQIKGRMLFDVMGDLPLGKLHSVDMAISALGRALSSVA
jgi:NifU-like protein involved in Fe-S cluster formation